MSLRLISTLDDDEFEEVESYDYFVAETEEDADNHDWEMIEE